ncbi:MAG: (deoxy)nucleoside triphosphate pyrophosphohydrolase [Spirochaetales bacterium]|nr:(deoxy)nucleoside triphosphate pyrophosphohydrolase [Spirochaetales bacterium]
MQKVSAAVFVKDGKFLIARRKKGGSLGNKWEFPGGKVEAGETPQEGLVREIHEEFDIAITVGEFIGSHRFSNEDKDYELMAYYTEYLDGELKLHEHQEIRWITLDDFDSFDFAESDRTIVEILKKRHF